MTTESIHEQNKTPVFRPEAVYRADEPDNEVFEELLAHREYQEVIGAFVHNASNTDKESSIALGPLDEQTLCRLGILNKKGAITKRGETALRSITVSSEALEMGRFDVKLEK